MGCLCPPALSCADCALGQAGLEVPEKSPEHKEAREITLTLDKQVGGMDSLSLDAVCTTSIGASVLPIDRCYCQTPVTHLGPRRDGTQHSPWAPPMPS